MKTTLFPVLLSLVFSNSACHSSAFNNESGSPKKQSLAISNQAPTPSGLFKVEQPKDSEVEILNENFRIVPEKFKYVDFKNLSYRYRLLYGRRIGVTLKDGEYEYDFRDDRGWFNLSDVYYADVTSDGNPEAIVMLWHVSCGVSCDGGAALFYVYTARMNKLKMVWQYETGSLAYGCGLKSFAVKNRNVIIELFGRCSDPRKEFPGRGKFQVEDTTRSIFRFNGRHFVEGKREFISAPERSVLNYKSEIRINE
jgi:hypothetical protein